MDEQEKKQLVDAVITQLKSEGTDVSIANIVSNANGIDYVVAYGKNGQIVRAVPTAISSEKVGATGYMNAYTEAGVYNINTNGGEDLPIDNQGAISARLTVLVTESGGNKVITQVLNLNNNAGGEGNVYIRSCQNGEWKAWGKLQTNIEVGVVNQEQLDALVDNGIYSGVLSTTGETFVIICINNYAIAQQVGVQHISHLKYSLVVGTGEVKIEKRTRDAYGIWTEWENIGGGSTLPEATPDTIGGVRLGSGYLGYLPIRNIDDNPYSGLGIKLGTKSREFNVVPLVLGTKPTGSYTWDTSWDMFFLGIPIDTRYFSLTNYGLTLGSGVNGDSATKVTWDADSNMNDFIIAGVYDIYGERTRQDDNLPILNASSGHSIAARLTVVASTLQPDNNEICVTQFLQLSNRVGGDGTTYVRTYNENNNGMNGWSAWQKQIGVVETLINGNDVTVGQELISQGHANKIGNGINGMIDNGMYSGIYVDTLNYTGTEDMYAITASPTFLETFVLIVINDYVLAGTEFPRHITQLKYAVDAMTGQSTVKKRVGTGDDIISWGDWEDIGGGGSVTIEVSYSTLLKLRDTESLIPGMKYRITDYITTTAQENTVSAGKPFDIIVTADTINSLNENAAACQNKDDGYFDDINFSAWELKYCLDNDTSRFAWADAENGKGVIYHMKDEHNNECSYDFKNIMFVRYKLNAPTVGGYPNEWQNRMSENINKMFEANQLSYLWHGVSDEDDCYWEDEMSEVISSPTGEAKAFFTFSNVIDDVVTDKSKTPKCHSNIIKESYQGNLLALNNNVFFSTVVTNDCNSNSFGNYCYYNSFGNYCNYNSFGNDCNSNSFGDYCYSNSFGNDCNSNSFGNDCNSNSFGDYCNSNSFGDYCYSNSFGNYCNYNSFGNNCNYNSFGNNCYSNSFGNDCNSNSFGNNCYYNSFGDYCNSNSFGNNCYSNSFGDYCNSNSFGNNCYSNGFFDDGSYAFDDNENEYLYDGIPLDYVQNNKFGDGCSHLLIYNVSEVGPDESIQNLNIAQGFSSISIDTANGVFYPEVIEIDTVGQDYEIKIARNSKGDVKIYCEADLIL